MQVSWTPASFLGGEQTSGTIAEIYRSMRGGPTPDRVIHSRKPRESSCHACVPCPVSPPCYWPPRFRQSEPVAFAQTPDPALVARARAIHDRVITLDTHNDINPRDFTKERNYTQRLDNQVNLPKMVEGGLDASFFIVYVGQGALTQEGYDQRLRAGGREVRRHPPAARRRSRRTRSAWR